MIKCKTTALNSFCVLEVDVDGDHADSDHVGNESIKTSLYKTDDEGWTTVCGKIDRATSAPITNHTRYETYIPPSNWHDHTPAKIVNHRKKTQVLPANAQPGSDTSVLPHGNQQNIDTHEPGRKGSLQPHQQTKGAIIRRLDFHHFPAGDAPVGQGQVTTLPNGGGQILQKKRHFLIVGRSGDIVRECPIYTYGDTGLRNRDKATWGEYCSLKPDQWRKGKFVNQSPGNKVLDMAVMASGRGMRDTMVVRLSDVRSRDVGMGGVELVGSISAEASEYAAEKALELMNEAMGPVDD